MRHCHGRSLKHTPNSSRRSPRHRYVCACVRACVSECVSGWEGTRVRTPTHAPAHTHATHTHTHSHTRIRTRARTHLQVGVSESMDTELSNTLDELHGCKAQLEVLRRQHNTTHHNTTLFGLSTVNHNHSCNYLLLRKSVYLFTASTTHHTTTQHYSD